MAPDRAGGVAPGEDSPTQGPGTQVLPLQTGGRRSAQCVNIQSAGSPHGRPSPARLSGDVPTAPTRAEVGRSPPTGAGGAGTETRR